MDHYIGFLTGPGFQILDLAGPLAAFEAANTFTDRGRYRCRSYSVEGGMVRSSSGLEILTLAVDDCALDTCIVTGGRWCRSDEQAKALVPVLQDATRRVHRLGSVCTGAFALAAAGLLDGRRATTHWRYAAELKRTYARVEVDGERIFIRDGDIWTSAGITAGIDLALAMIEDDHGADVARAVARDLVVYFRRPGGQAQFSTLLDLDPDSERIRRVLIYARDHLHEPLSVPQLAEIACLSPRQFSRTFTAETGESPAKAIERLRCEVARSLIESGQGPIESIADDVGFGDPERMRRAIIRLYGQPPQGLRRLATSSDKPKGPGLKELAG